MNRWSLLADHLRLWRNGGESWQGRPGIERRQRFWRACRLRKGRYKSSHAAKALLGVFCQGRQHHMLDGFSKRRDFLAQWRWRTQPMLAGNLGKRPLKWAFAREPFIDDHSQRIEIAALTWLTL